MRMQKKNNFKVNVKRYCKSTFGEREDEYSKYYQKMNKHWSNSGLKNATAMKVEHSNILISWTIGEYLKKLDLKKSDGVLHESNPILIGANSKFIYREVKAEGHGNCVLTPCEEELFCQVAEALGNMAFNLDRKHMKSMIDMYLINHNLIDDEFLGISETTLSRIMKRYDLTTTTKTNTIDVPRKVKS